MKKILLTLLIYIAYCIFVQCENDKLQESLVIATILSKTVNTVDPITLNENKKMQLLEENSNEIVLLSLNAIKEFTYQEGYEYKLSLLKTKIEKPEYIVDAPSFEYKLLNTISKMKVDNLGNHNPRLHVSEILIALTISATTNPLAEIAMKNLNKLAHCQAHSSAIIHQEDAYNKKKLKIDLTTEPEVFARKLYVK